LKKHSRFKNAFVENETIEEIRCKKKSCIFLSVYYEKTSNSISWNFIYYMLRLGFLAKWIRWMKKCLESSTLFDLVKGSPIEKCKPKNDYDREVP